MADYIGPTRTRVIAGDITLTDGGGDFRLTGVVGFGPCAVTWIATFADLAPSGRKVTLRLIAQAGRGSGEFQTINTVVNNPSSFAGTFSISIATREIVKVGFISGLMPFGALSGENQYGAATVTISLLGQTATYTQSTGTDGVGAGWGLRADTDLLGMNSSGGNAVSATTLPTSAATSAPSQTITRTGSYSAGGFDYNYDCTASADSSSASSSADADSTYAVTGIYARATSIVSPDRTATLHGRLQRMVATWPDPIRYKLYGGGAYTSETDGDFSASINQKQYDVTASVFDHLATFGSSTSRAIARERANILPSVENIGGLRIYGPRWDALSLAWTSTQTIDDGTSLSPTGTWAGDWTGAGGASLSIVSGAVRVTGSAGKSVSRSFSTSWQAYSRLRIRLACSAAAHDITLRLGADTTEAGVTYKAKTWTLTTGAGGAGTTPGSLYEFVTSPTTGTGENSTISFGTILTLSDDVTVTHLGVFDSGDDGVTSKEVRLYDGSSGSTLLETITFSSDGTLEAGFRYKALGSPRTLSAGTYRLAIAVGSATDTFFKPGVDSGSYATDTFGGRVSITGYVTGTSGGAPSTASSDVTIPASFKGTYGLAETDDLYIDLGAETSGPDYSVWDFGNQVPTPQVGGSYRSAYFGGGSALTLEDLGAGTYDIAEMELLTAPDGLGDHNAPLVHCFRDYLISQVDGILGFRYASQLSSGTIANLVSAINSGGPQGYSATDLSPAVSGAEPWPLSELETSRHTNVAIGGYGLLFAMSGSSPAWTYGFDASAFGIGALPAQWAVSEIAWDWPESDVGGFLWDDGAGGKAIGAGLSLGSSLWGRVLQESDTQTAGDDTAPAGRDPSIGTGVTLKSLSGVTLATETTEADGTFYFPALASIEGSARMLVEGQDGWVEIPFSAARSRVVVVKVTPGVPGTLLAMAVSATGRVVRAYRDTSDDIVLEFWNRSGWDAVTTSLSTTGSGAMTYDHQDNAGRLWLILEESGGIESRYTDDEGASFSVSTTIAATGTDPAICVSPTGLRHYFWRDSAAIKTKVLDSQNTAVVAATTVVASGVADSPIDAVHDGTLIHLTYKNTGNAVVTVVSSDGGLTFS